ncbi:MAG TPA: XVIPCD domain-containing protein [Pseudoxanthomonas sp.]|nr:XVIPCD domain-containing protein [Pseudoxanthomonas sp.]
MASPNPQLQAAIAQFSALPGVTPDQEAQLRAAITQDARLLRQLNQDAANGQLKGFALPQAGTAPNRAGTYDLASSVVTLPATSFQPTGTTPSADLVATLRLQDMGLRYAHSTYVDASNVTRPVTQDMVTNLQSVINGSPVLAAEIKQAVTPLGPGRDAPLQHFASLSGTVAGGTYSSTTHTMSLPPTSLAKPPASFGSADLTFVLGHEIQHGFNATGAKLARTNVYAQAEQIARDNNPVNDYTAPVRNLIQIAREDEAKAQIAGWNALLSREQQTKPTTDLTDMMALATNSQDQTQRTLDFVEQSQVNLGQAQARTGLIFNPDNTMSMTPANVAQMGQNYFDKPPKGTPGLLPHQTTSIGHHGNSDYPNYYGANAVTNIITIDRRHAHAVNGVAPRMEIDMGSLRLREDLMERNGIAITRNPNAPQPYHDIGTSPPKPGLFQHTATTHQHTSPIVAHPPEVPVQALGLRGPAASPITAGHPLVDQYLAALEAGDQQGARAASMAFATPERWQQAVADAEQRILATQRQLPGRDDPLFQQALTHLERLGPQAGGYLDRVQMESVAGAGAYQAKLHRLPGIDALTPMRDGQSLVASSTNPDNPSLIDRALIDKTQAAAQPLDQSLQQLAAETQRQQDQALLQAQQRQMETRQQGFSR